jgi:glycosyltransferase involved in cell wall biosynthesis
MISVLLIGPLPPPMGGDTRHFATLVEDLENHKRFGVKLINTSRGREHSRLLRNIAVALKTMLAVIASIRSVDVVSYHASDRGMFLFGPFIVGLSKLFGTPTVLRIFGGSFGDFYQAQGALKQAIMRRSILSSDVVLLQTRRAVHQLQEQATGKLVWFSTYIKTVSRAAGRAADEASDASRTCSRFVFLGHLWRTKGLETILDAAPGLPGDSRIDIYGPLDEYTAEEIGRRGMGRVEYLGFLEHSEVDARLWEYDCLVLPTHHPGEGYPGVIAEAFAHGLPVITTRWLAIPEIVDEECGILVEPNDTPAFVAAMTVLHQDRSLWRRLKAGARSKAAQFDHAVWSRKFEQICEELVRN